MSSAASLSPTEKAPAASPAPSPPGSATAWLVGLDQIAFSGANFASVVVVARFAGKAELGLYSLILSVVVLIAGFQRALVVSPYTFQGQRLSGRRRDRRRGSALVLSLIASVLFGVAIAIVWPLVVRGEVGTVPGWAVAVAVFGWGLRDSCRRLLFADHNYHEAAACDTTAAVLQVSVLVVLGLAGGLNALAALGVVGGTASVVSIVWMLFARRRFAVAARRVLVDLRASWRFGRWSALSEAVHAGQDTAVQTLLTWGGGLPATGAYAACASVVRLANPFVQAVGNAAGPSCARALAEHGTVALSSRVAQLSKLMIGTMAAFVLAVSLVGPFLIAAVYGAEFAGNALLLAALAAAIGLGGVGLIPAKAISAFEQPRINLAINVIGLGVVVGLAYAGLRYDVVRAVAFALFAGACATVTLRWFCFRRMVRAAAVAEGER